jgi:hypothetical protein
MIGEAHNNRTDPVQRVLSLGRAQGKCHCTSVGAIINETELKMQSANSERAARAVWVMCVVVPLVRGDVWHHNPFHCCEYILDSDNSPGAQDGPQSNFHS